MDWLISAARPPSSSRPPHMRADFARNSRASASSAAARFSAQSRSLPFAASVRPLRPTGSRAFTRPHRVKTGSTPTGQVAGLLRPGSRVALAVVSIAKSRPMGPLRADGSKGRCSSHIQHQMHQTLLPLPSTGRQAPVACRCFFFLKGGLNGALAPPTAGCGGLWPPNCLSPRGL